MPRPILYSYRRCPYAMRARMALHYSRINVDIIEIDLRNKPLHMIEVSPKGTVPVLALADGEVIEQSLDIMYWALAQHDADNWLVSQQEATQLIAENDGSFKQALDRYKYAVRFPEKTAEEHRADGELFLSKLETQLHQSAYLHGAHVSIADIAIFPFIRQFAGVDETWFAQSAYPRLRSWLQGLTGSALFTAIMQKPAKT